MPAMDIPSGLVPLFPVSPVTPTNTILNTSSCSGCGTPGSSRKRTRKVARTPSKQREETEPFDSLLDSFVQGLQNCSSDVRDERGVPNTLLTSTALHNNDGCDSYRAVSSIERTTQQIPIKLEDLFSESDHEIDEKEGRL